MFANRINPTERKKLMMQERKTENFKSNVLSS